MLNENKRKAEFKRTTQENAYELGKEIENELGKIAEYNDKLTALDELTELKW